MRAIILAAAVSVATMGAASAMSVAPSAQSTATVLPIVKAEVVKKVVVRHPARRVVKKTTVVR